MKKSAKTIQQDLMERLSPLLSDLGYEIVSLEVHLQRVKKFRIFIDHLPGSPLSNTAKGVSLDDCTRVAHALDESLDKMQEINLLFPDSYELEVSSPGLNRPLCGPKDFERFQGKQARIQVFRPLTAEELGNSDFQTRNPKQKIFLGILKGFMDGKVQLSLEKEKLKKIDIQIPNSLISKANLEPNFD